MSNTDSYCPICAENIGSEPFCSSCGDVSGNKREDYRLHKKQWYEEKQIRIFGKIVVEVKNDLTNQLILNTHKLLKLVPCVKRVMYEDHCVKCDNICNWYKTVVNVAEIIKNMEEN